MVRELILPDAEDAGDDGGTPHHMDSLRGSWSAPGSFHKVTYFIFTLAYSF